MAQQFYQKLIDTAAPIDERYRCVFELKNLAAIDLLVQSFPHLGTSELLKHELVYTLGQLDPSLYPTIKKFLYERVDDPSEQQLVRHEAAEAIANYFDPDARDLLLRNVKSGVEYLDMTCELGLQKIQESEDSKGKYGLLYFGTREPAAPFTQQEFEKFLEQTGRAAVFKEKSYLGVFLDPSLSLRDRYRVLYLLRNKNTPEAKTTICRLLSKEFSASQKGLFKHEICFVLGQIGMSEDDEKLVRECIENEQEEDIVRHQALSAVASQSSDEAYLDRFCKHGSQLIRESALVAIGSIQYWKS